MITLILFIQAQMVDLDSMTSLITKYFPEQQTA